MGTHQVVLSPGDSKVEKGRRRRTSSETSSSRYSRSFAAPAILWFVIFLLIPVGVLVFVSMGTRSATGGFEPALTVENYREVATRWEAVWNTIKFSVIGTLATLMVAFPVAYLLATRVHRGRLLLLGLIIVPFWTSMLIRTYAIMFLLGNGGVPYWISVVGFQNDWRLLNSGFAIVVGIVYNYLPLMLLPIYVTLEKIDVTYRAASKDLGANPLQTFAKVTLPLSLPGILNGCLLVSIPVMGEYLIPVLLGGGRTYFLGNALVDLFLQSRNWPLGAAVATSFIAIMAVIVILYAIVEKAITPAGENSERAML